MGRIPVQDFGDMDSRLCAARTIVLTFTCSEYVLSLMNEDAMVQGSQEGRGMFLH